MSAFAKIQSIGASKPYFGFSKLNVGYHKISSFKLVKNKFDKDESKSEAEKKCIMLELEDEVVFLPQYFTKTICEDDIYELNTAAEPQYLYFGGPRVRDGIKYVYSSFGFNIYIY